MTVPAKEGAARLTAEERLARIAELIGAVPDRPRRKYLFIDVGAKEEIEALAKGNK